MLSARNDALRCASQRLIWAVGAGCRATSASGSGFRALGPPAAPESLGRHSYQHTVRPNACLLGSKLAEEVGHAHPAIVSS